MMKVYRPLWSYDVKKTEDWLTSMAEKGYHLVKLNRWTRCFFFRQGERKRVTFRIGFDKVQGESLPKSLQNAGWVKVLRAGNWYVLSNEKPLDEIKTSSVRDGIIKHNKLIRYIFIGLFGYLSFTGFIDLLIWGLTLFGNATVEIVDSPMWIVTYIAAGLSMAIYLFSIYSIIKISKSNKYLMKENRMSSFEENMPKEREKQLKQSGQMVAKRKGGWMYAPDKLEKWLETREELGFHLYRVGKTGSVFYFLKESPRKISYCVDYQNVANDSYANFLRDTGWESVYSSSLSLQKWTIWRREYGEGEEKPQIYSDKTQRLKHARRVAITYSLMFLPLVIAYLLNISLYFGSMQSKQSLWVMCMFVLSVVLFGSFIVRIWLYYMRLRKR